MPVVSIRTLPLPGLEKSRAATRIGAAIAEAAATTPDNVWVVLTDVPGGQYVVADSAPQAQPDDSHPALVDISIPAGRSADLIDETLRATARAVGAELGIPSRNVRVTYNEVPLGRFFSRDRLR